MLVSPSEIHPSATLTAPFEKGSQRYAPSMSSNTDWRTSALSANTENVIELKDFHREAIQKFLPSFFQKADAFFRKRGGEGFRLAVRG